MKSRNVLILMCVCAALIGCPREDSCNVLTSGICFTFRVVEQDGQATATAVFTVGNALGTELALGDCGDDITVNGTALQEIRGAFVHYEAVIDPADTYTFVFTREGEDPYTSVVAPPPTVTITAPAAGTVISRAEAFDITWDNNYEASPGIGLFIGGPCVQPILRDIGDNGAYTINADELAQRVIPSCDLTISLTRTTIGTMDPATEGTILAHSVDQTWITTNP